MCPLERRTELARGKPLDRGTSQLRRTELIRKPMKAYRPKAAVSLGVRLGLVERSSGWCEAQLVGCWGRATDPAHRITRKAGGRHGEAKAAHDRLSDVCHLCRWCHDWCGDQPAAAGAVADGGLGLVLKEHHIPEIEPVMYRGRLALLDNDGGVTYLPTTSQGMAS